ncbi:MAG: PAS domain S-box protein [Rhodospirillaceae bacterium]|nr:PAS domain S-box protein [Rhodospirillaceae bacterium]MBT6588879.1 PAS domain S-box protein [Rhodospirillaceae bacterium]MBT6910579.1 PAS domain S-box protein [Rhodospirillaceae bacterium]
MFVSLIIAIAFGVGLLLAFKDYQRALERERFAEVVATTAYQLTALTAEYLLDGGARVKIQWGNTHRSLGKFIAAPGPITSADVEGIAPFRRHHAKAGELFARAMNMDAAPKDVAVSQKQLMARILTITQAMASMATQSANASRVSLDETGVYTSRLVAGFFVLLAISMLGLWLVLKLRVIGPIRQLEDNIVALGDGQKELRLPIKYDDEIGAVAAALNQMTERLRQTSVSRDALLAEVEVRRKAEATAEAAQIRLMGLIDIAPEAIIAIGHDRKIQLFNQGAERIFGYRTDEVLGQPLQILMPEHLRETHENYVRAFETSKDSYRRMNEREEITGLRKDGTEFPASASVSKQEIDGEIIFTVMLQDTSVRTKIQDALATSEQLIRSVVDNVPASIILKDIDGRVELVNPTHEKYFNTTADDILGKTSAELYSPSVAARLEAADREVIASGMIMEEEIAVNRPDLPIDFVHVTKFPVFDQAGKVSGVGTFTTDISAQKMAEESLRQAQRMEAIGQLTGGVAHDFNNLLAAIIGNLDLIDQDSETIPEFDKQGIAIALRAAFRGAELTDRLLAFSRRQELDANVTNINDLLPEFAAFAKTTMGEDIAIESKLGDDLWTILVDAGQLENALLNLAINARDAMPRGGQLIIETANRKLELGDISNSDDLVPGEYVMVAVRDDGSGMPAGVQERVFEPFFTTKGIGEGSGLGLSMVFGFAKQSGGQVAVHSTEGEGTSIEIYLPRVVEEIAAEDTSPLGAQSAPTGNETILVVEDNEDLLVYLVKMLSRLGYTVLQAADGPVALEVMATVDHIDLLLTDVVLPRQMSGRDVEDAFLQRYPAAGVLYTSGYTRDALNRRSPLDPQVGLINKPFRTEDLAQRVRQALDNSKAQDNSKALN